MRTHLKNRFSKLGGKMFKQKQQGLVLFFALIALVVMSLAAVALIRSIDTNSLIAGSLSFKQSSMFSADRGVENAITWIKTENSASLNDDDSANGYFATSAADARALVDANGFADMTDTQGNTISYVVQRMCSKQGLDTDTYEEKLTNCLFAPGPDPGCKETPDVCKKTPPLPTKQIIYRITAKVVGPRNTTSYIQTFAF